MCAGEKRLYDDKCLVKQMVPPQCFEAGDKLYSSLWCSREKANCHQAENKSESRASHVGLTSCNVALERIISRQFCFF